MISDKFKANDLTLKVYLGVILVGVKFQSQLLKRLPNLPIVRILRGKKSLYGLYMGVIWV